MPATGSAAPNRASVRATGRRASRIAGRRGRRPRRGVGSSWPERDRAVEEARIRGRGDRDAVRPDLEDVAFGARPGAALEADRAGRGPSADAGVEPRVRRAAARNRRGSARRPRAHRRRRRGCARRPSRRSGTSPRRATDLGRQRQHGTRDGRRGRPPRRRAGATASVAQAAAASRRRPLVEPRRTSRTFAARTRRRWPARVPATGQA